MTWQEDVETVRDYQAVGTAHPRDALDRLSARLARYEEALRDPEALARAFHEAYERLAPYFQYETRTESAVPFDEVPEPNRQLMIETAREVIARAALADEDPEA